MRKVDKLGRIVIPKELREKYGLEEGASIDFQDFGEGILVKASANLCKICECKLSDDSDFPICENCAMDLISAYSKK
jgi:transcriptional pleiotropic regulator of transition state genes